MSSNGVPTRNSVFKSLIAERACGRGAVVATVVKTWGSTPQKAGARLLVLGDGSGVGTLGGGCVEGDIWFASSELLKRGGAAEWRDYTLNEDLAAQDGLVCGGTMRFLIDPITAGNRFGNFSEEVVKASEGGIPVAIASVVRTPQDNKGDIAVGDSLLIRENGTIRGSLGGGDMDARIAKKAAELMAMGKSTYISDDSGYDIYIEAWTTPPTLILAGGGHVSKAIATVAKSVGMRMFVFDDRKEFANEERFPDAEGVFTGDYIRAFEDMPINANSFIIIATRGHRYDAAATEAALNTPASFIGLLGSRRKSVLVFEELLLRGIPPEQVRRVRSPVGLDLGARTPEEIAVSIIAEVLAFRLSGTGAPMMPDDRMFLKASERVARINQRQAKISSAE